LYNGNGQIIREFTGKVYPGENNIEFNVNDLSKGIYLLKITDNTNHIVRRFLKR
jgi:hypothetical protein